MSLIENLNKIPPPMLNLAYSRDKTLERPDKANLEEVYGDIPISYDNIYYIL